MRRGEELAGQQACLIEQEMNEGQHPALVDGPPQGELLRYLALTGPRFSEDRPGSLAPSQWAWALVSA